MKIIRFFFTCIVLFLTVSFAVSNKQPFVMTLWPFPFEIELPVSFVILAFALIFFVLGAFYNWLLSFPLRSERSRQAKKIKELTRKVEEADSENQV